MEGSFITVQFSKTMILATKDEMYNRYQRGAFGNKPRIWHDYGQLEQDPPTRPVTMRYKGKGGGGFCNYNVQLSEVPAIMQEWAEKGADTALITFNEGLPDDRLEIQGEVMQSAEHLSLRYSTEKLPMRLALKKSQSHVSGVIASLTLKHFLDPTSLDELYELLDIYPGAVIEFGTYSVDVGTVPRRNTIFWEVRHY